MQVLNLNHLFIDREKRIYTFAILLSLIFHLILFFALNFYDLINIDLSKNEEEHFEEVTVIFPENKPKQIVENMNESDQIPEKSDLLSDRNSRARNQQFLDQFGYQPMSEGNIPYPNLTQPNVAPSQIQNPVSKKFSKDALVGKQVEDADNVDFDNKEVLESGEQSAQQMATTNNIYEQKEFSADQVGDVSLSTYAWEWAPYINAFKRKLYQVWFSPSAYYRLGLIHGYTVIHFSISRDGELLDFEVLEHKGHESLEQSSVNAIKSVFPFKKLPDHFPDEKLSITARLIYPNLRERR